MTQYAHLTNCWIFSLHFHNDVCLLQEHPNTKNHVIWCSGWSGVDIWKVGFTPRPLGTVSVPRSFQAQVLWTACNQGYHLTLSLKTARHRQCPGIMPKPYPFWALDNEIIHTNQQEPYHLPLQSMSTMCDGGAHSLHGICKFALSGFSHGAAALEPHPPCCRRGWPRLRRWIEKELAIYF